VIWRLTIDQAAQNDHQCTSANEYLHGLKQDDRAYQFPSVHGRGRARLKQVTHTKFKELNSHDQYCESCS
jgi:hypothetical protein